MSQQLIGRSADLQRLEQDGFDIEVVGQFLLVRDVPYVNGIREVKRGVLVTPLALSADVTTAPDTHVAYFSGEYPCDQDGRPIEQIRHSSATQALHPEVTVQHSFSSKPAAGYADYHVKMTTYAAILSGPARALDPSATPHTFPVVTRRDEDSVFAYQDTSSSRAKIVDLNARLGLSKVAIIGLGGTGSYVLDLVAKTPVREIHLIDGDVFSQHNAFRCPGAPSVEDLRRKPAKVQYLTEQYGRMRKGIVPHATQLDASNLQLLDGVEFVFLCIDSPTSGDTRAACRDTLPTLRAGSPIWSCALRPVARMWRARWARAAAGGNARWAASAKDAVAVWALAPRAAPIRKRRPTRL